ncbi:phospholipase D-like domain-containing protein [Candidatus Omnitrophota bacterium]
MNPRHIIIALIAISLLTAPLSASGAPKGDPKLLLGKDYFTTLQKHLREAKDSIVVAVYIIQVPEEGASANPASVLLEELIDAKSRGVSVKVILDNTKFNVNYNAFKRLEAAGVDVFLDSPKKLMHGKAVVIDGEISIVGSTNWTRSSINRNDEFSLITGSREVSTELLDYISKMEVSSDVPVLAEEADGVGMPADLITGERGLSLLFTNRSEKAFDLYLYLLKKSAPIRIDYEELGRYLGYTKNYYFNVRQPLNKLVRKYRLVTHKPWSKYLSIKPLGGNTLTVPYTYWEYGFDKSLSFSAKFMYLVSLLEARKSARNPYWFRSNSDLAEMYHIGEKSVSGGIKELERENILEVTRFRPAVPGNFKDRPANTYRLNKLVSRGDFESALTDLSDKYGEEVVLEAREFSEELNEPRDIEIIEIFIDLINTYGYERVREVNSIVAKKRLETGFRSIEQTMALLKQ